MLQNFGFTQYESQVYEVLSASDHALDAATVVKFSHVPKSKVYEVLQRLVEKGLILTSFHEKKKLYTALPIEMTIKSLQLNLKIILSSCVTTNQKFLMPMNVYGH